MDDFPDFMKNPANAVGAGSQSAGLEGFVFEGRDGSQMAFWTAGRDGVSAEHVHDFDEYMVVIQGRYKVVLPDGGRTLGPGEELHIVKGLPHGGEFTAGTRTIHCFGGRRVRT
ncbi:MAG: cupin [Proteobacteria bacterium]|nr:cupin [Pseudomonadota bacterium]